MAYFTTLLCIDDINRDCVIWIILYFDVSIFRYELKDITFVAFIFIELVFGIVMPVFSISSIYCVILTGIIVWP